MSMSRARRIARAAAPHLLLVVMAVLTLFPVLWVIKMALSPAQHFSLSLNPLPETVSLANFRDVMGTRDMAGRWLFAHQLINSLAAAAGTTVLGILLSCSAAYAFSRFRFPGRRAGMLSFLVVQMFPGVMMAIPLYILIDSLGLLNHIAGLVLIYATTSVPFCVWMLKGYFDTIPVEMEEAALVDGASRWTIFWRIVLPLARPAVAVTALFSFMTAWNEFILAATFMNRAEAFTLPVALQRYVGDFSTEWGRFAAGAVLVSIPVMALFYVLQRHLVGGLTAGGIKG